MAVAVGVKDERGMDMEKMGKERRVGVLNNRSVVVIDYLINQ